ncbi:MAG: hypothetical protein IH895_03790 [Planctomycetes bacterium]|nr:hypothetical protein [Planctomycetota bacterium]
MGLLTFAAALAQVTTSPTSTKDDTQVLLDDLSDPSYEVRQAAVEKLYAAGPAVLDALSKVTKSDDFEAALRARNLIKRIQKLFFVGAKIELSASHKQIRWDEPVSLRIKIINPSDFPIHLPFLVKNRGSIDTDPLAAQMGNLLDAADFLSVVGPDGKAADPVVDDLRGEPSLEAALDTRVYAEPASLLAPHSEFILNVPDFNRGFARYRMLRKGTYRLQFAYVPEWDDHKMREDGIGKVVSNALTLTVTQPAPDLILNARREIRVGLERVGREFVVRLTNTHDRPMGVNLNLGNWGLAYYAHMEWQWRTPAGVVRAAQPLLNPSPLDTEKLVKLKPGQSIELFRTDLNRLKTLPGFEHMGRDGENTTLAVRYTNILDRALLLMRRRQEGPNQKKWKRLYEAMPLPTFVGSCTSDPVQASSGAPDRN